MLNPPFAEMYCGRQLPLTLVSVGFYAALNLIAWFMIFCFVRETKQLTLEELDRKYTPSLFLLFSISPLLRLAADI